MSLAVSVVVPVWNPGPNLRRCIDSLLGQTMPASDYEIVLVDDGSTDGTAERLDAIAAAEPERVRVLHIPPSGWPGKPRNVGIDAARGEYVHLVDNDDTLPPYALEALSAAGRAAGADVVMGRPASDFRGLNHRIYHRTIPSCTLADFPDLTDTLTPHKMFRRGFLHEHGIRFPEGPVPLEDQMFVMRAYLHAKAITVLGDRPYYFYLRRVGSGRNAGDRHVDPVKQCAATEQVIDIVDELTSDAELRDRLHRRFYRINLLSRLSEQSFIDHDDDWRRALAGEIRRVIADRITPGAREGATATNRMQDRLLMADDLPGLAALAEQFRSIRVNIRPLDAQWRDSVLWLEIDAALHQDDQPLRCEPSDGGWALPETLAPTVPLADRTLDPSRDPAEAELSLVSRLTSVSFGITEGLTVGVDDEGVIRVRGMVGVDPAAALAGNPMTDGLWDVRLRVWFAGFNRWATVRVEPSAVAALMPLVTPDGRVVLPYIAGDENMLALDVGQWHTALVTTVAPAAQLEVLDRRRLLISVGVLSDARTPPPVQLLLQPEDGTDGGLRSCVTTLQHDTGHAVATIKLPRLPDGSWRAWLRVADTGAGPAVELPCVIRSAGRALHVEPVALPPG